MLTVDLVRARRRGGDLTLVELKGRTRLRARQLAEAYLELARGQVGSTRGAFEESCANVLANPRERKLALGFKKLVEDLCHFESDDRGDARELRRLVFQRASAVRRELAAGEVFDRDKLLRSIAHERGHGETPEDLVGGLYTDLREAQMLREAPAIDAETLVTRYDIAQAQAVLLRATRVVAEVQCANPATYRYLFGKLKFRRLLSTIQRQGKGYRIDIDGPFSLFSSVTKYGLQLALMLPALQACDTWSLRADVLWGKERVPLRFAVAGGLPKKDRKKQRATGTARANRKRKITNRDDLPEEVVSLFEQVKKRQKEWDVELSTAILDLPGAGLCVPDLRFVHTSSGTEVFLEVMGFWSRDAVWKRVELVQSGLPFRIIFAVPKRLRVSEEVLDDELPGELYVYKGKLNVKEILLRLDAMVS